MRPAAGQVLHFSEDPTITRFEPHVAATAQQPEAYVWAVDARAFWDAVVASTMDCSGIRLRNARPR